jgi:hypothetical protein
MRIALVTPGPDFEFESVPGTDYIYFGFGEFHAELAC